MYDLSALSDKNEFLQVFSNRGFPDADVQTVSLDVVFSSADEFTRSLAVGSIMRRTGTTFSEETLDLMSADVAAELESYIGVDGLVFPMQAHLLTAAK